MPIYTFKCKNNHVEDKYINVNDYDSEKFKPCSQCGEIMQRNYSQQNVKGVVKGGTGGGRKRIK